MPDLRCKSVKVVLILTGLFVMNVSAFEKHSDGIVIKLPTKTVKIQVCDENIIRVIAAPVQKFSSRPSLVVEKTKWDKIPFTAERQGQRIIVSTNKIDVKISESTGEIVFCDKSGSVILQEQQGGGKIITPANVMGEETYHIQQIFKSPPDEAFYGLGQHQNNIINYKGSNVDLCQYNIVVAVPFLVSSRNYGILWDNTSRTKFGDIRDYQPVSSLILYDKTGKKGGLSAEYFSDKNFKSQLITRTESVIDHESLDKLKGFPEGFNAGKGSIRWSGELESAQSGVHKLRLYSSSYIKMWVNNKLVADSWRQNWLPWTHIIDLPMEAGKRYLVKIEWIPDGGFIGLKYLTPEIIDSKTTTSLYSEVADQIDYYFIYGQNIDEVISGYRQITGKAPLMPKWAMGLWQSRERYKTQDELLSVVKEFRKRNIPLDNIVLDWRYWQDDKWGSHEFDASRFPNPESMIKELHARLNTKIMISVWPKFYVGLENYNQFKEKNWLYMRNVEMQEKDWVTPGYVSTFYDPYSQGARKLFWQQVENKLFKKGIDSWWLDATEPDIHSNLSETEKILRMGPTAMGSASRFLNTYSLMATKAVYEGQRKTDPDKRVFILTRSAFAGQQRYAAATWSGDIAARWEDLRAQIPAGLNFSISGIPYWSMDIGGFAVERRYEKPNESDLDEWRELNTRWFQFGAFCPIFRVHGQLPYREMFNIAPENHPAYQAMLAYDKLRYRLMPYIYSLAGMVTHSDYTMMRPLVMDFGYDPNVLNIGDEFMFGPALLINPVTEYKARSRKVYLPAGSGWYELKTGRYFNGGQIIDANAPYTDIPIFVKEGSIIPFGPDIQYTTEKPAEKIRLFVYTGKNGEFNIYEDEGVNYNYEKGAYSIIPLKYDQASKTLTIGERKGKFAGMLKERTFEIIWVGKENPVGLDFEKTPDRSVIYNGNKITIFSRNKSLSSFDSPVKNLLSKMTLEEKIGQMIQAEHGGLKDITDVEKYYLGSVLSGGNSDPENGNSLAAWTDLYDTYQKHALKTRLGIPLLYGIDAVHGHNNVLGAVIFPHNIGLGCTRDPNLIEKIARVTAAEVRATGINWTFSPCVTVPQDIRWGRTYEGFSEDPELVKLLGEAVVCGYQGSDLNNPLSILACAKHYVGDGGTTFGSAEKTKMLDQGDTRVGETTLRKIHLLPYTAAIQAGVGSIMPSYSSWNSIKCSANKHLLTEVLKEELCFEGFLISDYSAIKQINPDYKTAVEISINAGMDMAMEPKSYREFFTTLKELIEEGKVPMSRIDDAVTRILRVKFAMGLMDKNKSVFADRNLHKQFGSAEHREIARRAVRQSLVLLKNEKKTLPISKKTAHICVAGESADDIGNQCGGWTIEWQGKSGNVTTGGTTILQAIKNSVSPNTKITFSKDGTNVKGSDVGIVVIGEKPYAEGNGDTVEPVLAKEDIEAVRNMKKAGMPVVVILISGRPLIINDILKQADAVIAAWLPGTEGQGVVDVLFGDYRPTGKLSFTWPRDVSQIPLGADKGEPLFKYGYGLTY